MAEKGNDMSLIYEPRGKAREYSPLALNVYSGGCDHACRYCYCADMGRAFGRDWTPVPMPRDLAGLPREAEKASRQVLMCFVSDPYCAADVQYGKTREALTILRASHCSVAILTKGGSRCLRDLDIFRGWPDGRVKVGATLTFRSASRCAEWEPGAACPDERIDALRQLHAAGVKTWASIEPVIDPVESLAIIEASLPYVDAYKVGKWNHDARANATDWPAFGRAAVDMIRAAGRRLYVKADLRPHMPDGYLTAAECDMNSLSLPERPTERTLFA
jgi:DNA repair photolyase